MLKKINFYNLRVNNYSNDRIIGRLLLISEKIIGFFLTAYLANRLSYSDIGFWSQVIYFAGLYTSLIGLNIGNGLISIIPRINKTDEKIDLILKSGLFLVFLGTLTLVFLTLIKDIISNLFFDNILDFNIFWIILIIGFCNRLYFSSLFNDKNCFG